MTVVGVALLCGVHIILVMNECILGVITESI